MPSPSKSGSPPGLVPQALGSYANVAFGTAAENVHVNRAYAHIEVAVVVNIGQLGVAAEPAGTRRRGERVHLGYVISLSPMPTR